MIAYTIVSRAYIPHARVLARSYAEHHPGEKLWALLIDDVKQEVQEAAEPFRVLHLDDLDLDLAESHRMAMLFGDKIIAAIKPWVFEYFLKRGAESVLYLDGDFVIYDSLKDVIDAAQSGVILIPHVLNPIPQDGLDPSDTRILGAGMFNAGMFGVNADGAAGFIEFLQNRLKRECIFDAKRMRYNEQRWLDFVPALFPYSVVRDPGIDVAYWNLHERKLASNGISWTVNGKQLRAFHFSAFDPRAIGVGGRFELDPAPRIRLSQHKAFAALCQEYRSALFSEGFEEVHETPFAFDQLPEGAPVYHALRQIFAREVLLADTGGKPYPPDPFVLNEANEFRTWTNDAFSAAGLKSPQRVVEAIPQHSTLRRRVKSQLRRGRSILLESFRSTDLGSPTWSVDWLGKMITDDAAEDCETHLAVRPTRDGFICHGPRVSLKAGIYRATLEFNSYQPSPYVTPLDQAIVVEGFVQGYVVGSTTATYSEVGEGTVEMSIVIPRRFEQEALLFGLEIRVLSRGHLDVRLQGVILEAFGIEPPELPASSCDWLPVMAGGEAGRRAGIEVAVRDGCSGVVVSGPNWRLLPGSYTIAIRTRTTEASLSNGAETAEVAEIEIVDRHHVMAKASLTYADLVRGEVALNFDVTPDHAAADSQVGLQLRTTRPLEAVITGVTLVRTHLLETGS